MNKLEKFVYDAVKTNPRIKLALRDIYQSVFDLLPSPKAMTQIPIVSRTGYFFGFHDHVPFSSKDHFLAAHRILIPLRMPRLGDEVEIGYFSGDGWRDYHKVGTSRAWTWHMGAKLQWRGDSNQVVYNDHESGKNVARMVDIHTGHVETIGDSVGSVSPDGKWAVGYNFARVARCMPGYGYEYDIGDPEINSYVPTGHGIHLLDCSTGQIKQLISLKDLVELQPETSMDQSWHFVTHTVFSPNSKRFIFLHRWTKRDVTKRWSRLISCDINGRDIYVFPTQDMVSHISWKDSETVIAYCRLDGLNDQYVLFPDRGAGRFEILGQGTFNSDGHPSFEPSGRWMVTDTYPDRRRVQRLVLFDAKHEKRHDICKLPMPRRFRTASPYRHWTCDLHPRWNRGGEVVCFDATFEGVRSLCTVDVESFLSRND